MYEEILLTCLLVLNDDGTHAKLDIPFHIHHQECVVNGVKYGPYPLPKELAGQKALALVTVSTEERRVKLPDGTEVISVENCKEAAEKFAGRITDFQKDARVAECWTLTKEDALATVSVDSKTGVETVVKYDGADKLEKAQFYPSSVFAAKVVEPINEEPIEELWTK